MYRLLVLDHREKVTSITEQLLATSSKMSNMFASGEENEIEAEMKGETKKRKNSELELQDFDRRWRPDISETAKRKEELKYPVQNEG